MKILIVIDSLGSGGAQKQKALLAEGFIKKGYEVDLFSYNSSENFFKSDFLKFDIKLISIHNFKLSNTSGFSMKVLLKLRSIFNNYDNVIASLHSPSIYSAIASIGKKTNLIICEESSSLAPINFLKKTLFYFSCLVSNSVVANSFSEHNKIKKRIGLNNKTHSIWNGYLINSLQVEEKVFNKKIKTLLVVGRIAYPKNALNLLKGIKIFYNQNGWMPNLIWAGRKESDSKSVKMQNDIDDFLKKNPTLKTKINFIGEKKNIRDLYQKSDALILPSIYEGLPNVICEAMINGCCVLASNVSDNKKILDNNRGLIFDPLDPKSISNSILRFNNLSSKDKNTMRYKSKKFADENFTLDKMIKSFEELLRS